jgi:hypothetical protein
MWEHSLPTSRRHETQGKDEKFFTICSHRAAPGHERAKPGTAQAGAPMRRHNERINTSRSAFGGLRLGLGLPAMLYGKLSYSKSIF